MVLDRIRNKAYQDEIDFSFSFPSLPELNLKDITALENISANTLILFWILHTSVDKAEVEKELSDKINI